MWNVAFRSINFQLCFVFKEKNTLNYKIQTSIEFNNLLEILNEDSMIYFVSVLWQL